MMGKIPGKKVVTGLQSLIKVIFSPSTPSLYNILLLVRTGRIISYY